jgi:hypothetical protein
LGAGEDKMFRESSLIREKQYVSEWPHYLKLFGDPALFISLLLHEKNINYLFWAFAL